MQLATSGYTNHRNPAGIAVTVALHVGLVAAALIGFGVVEQEPWTGTPAIKQIPNIPLVEPKRTEPRTIDQKVEIYVPEPVFTTAPPPPTDLTTTIVIADPGPVGGTATTDTTTIDKPQLPPGETRSASIDPRYRSGFQPPYPSASQRIGEEGTVVVRVVVGTEGRVVRASVARSSGFARLDEAALKRALVTWRFVPALRDGVAVEAEREIPVTFRLMQG